MSANLIPEGRWRARAMNAELGYTQSGNEQVVVNFSLSGDQDEEVDHRMITWWGSFSEKAEPHTLKALLTMGWDGDSLAELAGIDQLEVELVIQHEDDLRGQPRARVRFINAVGSGSATVRNPMTDEQKTAFAQRMKGKTMALQQAAAKPQPTAAPAPKPAPARAPTTPKPAPARKAASSTRDGVQVQPDDDDQIPF